MLGWQKQRKLRRGPAKARSGKTEQKRPATPQHPQQVRRAQPVPHEHYVQMFRLADKYKSRWMHPRSKHWHMIDFVIVRQRDLQDVRITRAMRGAECWTDQRLARVVFNLHIAPLHRNKPRVILQHSKAETPTPSSLFLSPSRREIL